MGEKIVIFNSGYNHGKHAKRGVSGWQRQQRRLCVCQRDWKAFEHVQKQETRKQTITVPSCNVSLLRIYASSPLGEATSKKILLKGATARGHYQRGLHVHPFSSTFINLHQL